jgi:4'-phosphopantetheinyl transferase EntD
MPLVYQHIINENTKLAVWSMEEHESFIAETIGFVTGINHPQKRLQSMAGRYLLKLLAPGLDVLSLKLNPSGKPIDPSGKIKFSISHSGNRVAVMVSEDFNVGIDIQFPEEKLLSLKNKFLSENDMLVLSALNQPETIQLCLGWSVKETLFKWYGNGRVDFKKHLHILSASILENGFSFRCVFSKDQQISIPVYGFIFEENVVTYTYV